jgi:hypothetical protein
LKCFEESDSRREFWRRLKIFILGSWRICFEYYLSRPAFIYEWVLTEALTQVKETLLVAGEGRVWCLEDRLVLGGFDWDPTLQEKACWSRRPFGRVCMPLDKWRGVHLLLLGDTLPLSISAHLIFFLPLQFSVFKILVVLENERYCDEDFSS